MKTLFFGLFIGLTGLVLMGFNFSKHSIPLDEILSGGPSKDGIPALLKPKFVLASKATFLKDNDRVLGLAWEKDAKAYPIRILNWHEIVNDTLDRRPVLISYCPLCGTGMAFDTVLNNKKYTFGVSGLLYKSDVLMYDHQTESLWSQIKQEAVTGDLTGSRLILLPLIHTTWGRWKAEHPNTMGLSPETGYLRDYSRDPYVSYARSPRLMFPSGKQDERLGPKDWVLGIELDGVIKAYPFTELQQVAPSVSDSLGSKSITINFDPATRTAWVEDAGGRDVPSVVAYWFAWIAFHPKTEVYEAKVSKE